MNNTKRKTENYKSDSSVMLKRINTVYLLKIQGFQRKDIIQYCADNFKVGERQTDKYIFDANKMFKDNIDKHIDDKKFEILNQYYDLYQKNYKDDDFRECRNILKDISIVLGVEAPRKTEIITNSITQIVLTDAVTDTDS